MCASKHRLMGGRHALWLVARDLPLNFALTLRLRGSFTEDELRHALDRVKCQYPSAATRVFREPDGRFYQIDDPDLQFPIRIVERQSAESWVEHVTAELARPFDERHEPPVRVIWVRGDPASEIVLLCDHTFVDGFSAVYAGRDLLAYLGDPHREAVPGPSSTPMSELIPDFPGKRRATWRGKTKAAFFKLVIALSPKKGDSWPAMVAKARTAYGLLPWELTAEQTSALVEQSRAHGTTVHAALCAAFLRAFGEYYGTGWRRKIQSPIDLRKRLARPVGEAFELYIQLAEFWVNCAPDLDFWAVAREIKEGFGQHTGDRQMFGPMIELMVLMDDLASVVTPQLLFQSYGRVEYDLSITNLGRLDIPLDYGPLHLDAVYGPTIGCNPDEIVLGVVTTGGQMRCTLSFPDKKFTPAQAQEVKDKALRHLAAAAGW